MNYLDMVTSYISTLLIAGGGGAAIGVGLFKTFGEHWLKKKFDEQQQELQEQHAANLKRVQFFIDKEMHRAKKLYDKEFDVLSDAWATLDTLYGYVIECTVDPGFYDWSEASQQDIRSILDETSFTRAQKRQVANAPEPDQAVEFRTIEDWNRRERYIKASNDFAEYLRSQGIFMPKDLRGKFGLLNTLIHRVFIAFEIAKESGVQFGERIHVLFSDEHKAVRQELGDLIHARFWSADGEKANPEPEVAPGA